METVFPILRVLTDNQVARVHRYSSEILSDIGIRVDSEKARKLLVEAGGKIIGDYRIAISQGMVEHALKSVPSSIDIFDRLGNKSFRLGGEQEGHTRFGIGVTNLYYQEPGNDMVTPFERRHTQISAKLGQALNSFDVISTIGVPRDVPPELSDFYATLDITANSTKPLVLLVSDDSKLKPVLHLLEHLYTDISSKPFIIPYLNPITPLVLNDSTFEKLEVAIEAGLPVMYSNYGMSGATTPVTPAGTLAVLNAELLAGLTISQLIKPGAKIILGSLPAGFDMVTMGSVYTPQSFLVNLACAEMMHFYKIPHCGTSGCGVGWGPDLLASGNLWMNTLTACIGKVGLAPFVGGNFDSMAFSPATVVYTDHIIQQAKKFAQGFSLCDESVSMSEIAGIGPGGDFLTANSTLNLFMESNYSSSIWPNLSIDKWIETGQPDAGKFLRDHTVQLINSLSCPRDCEEIYKKGEAFIRELKK